MLIAADFILEAGLCYNGFNQIAVRCRVDIFKKQKKKRIPKKLVLYICAIAVAFVVLVTGLVMLLTRGRELSDTMIELPFDSSAQYFGVGQNIVYTEQELLTCVDTSLNTVWQIRLFSGDLDFTANSEIIAATGQGVIQVINASGQHLFSTQLDGDIGSARVGHDKVAVYVSQTLEENTPAYIIVFALNGTSLFQIDVTDRYVLDYGFDADSNFLYLLELDVSGSVPVSRISTYRPESQSMTGIKELKDQLVSDLHIIGDQIYAMGTNRLTVYKSLSTDIRSVMVYGWVLKDVYYLADPRFVYVRSDSDSEDIAIARVIRGSGSDMKINLPPGVYDILHGSEKIYCFANDRIFVYTDEGKYQRAYSMPFDIGSVERANGKYAFLTAEDKVYLLPLP